MSKQMTLGTGFEKYSKTTRREKFLTEMDGIVPWGDLCALIWPVYPKAGDGRPPKELEMMLRIYFVQQWFNLSDPGVEEALYDSVSMRRFAGIDLGEMPVPDESTVCRFRHLLEAHALGLAPARLGVFARSLARGGDTRLGRLGLSRAARGHPSACAEGERLHPPSLSVQGFGG